MRHWKQRKKVASGLEPRIITLPLNTVIYMNPDWVKPDRAAAAAGMQPTHWASKHTHDAHAVCQFELEREKNITFHTEFLNKA